MSSPVAPVAPSASKISAWDGWLLRFYELFAIAPAKEATVTSDFLLRARAVACLPGGEGALQVTVESGRVWMTAQRAVSPDWVVFSGETLTFAAGQGVLLEALEDSRVRVAEPRLNSPA